MNMGLRQRQIQQEPRGFHRFGSPVVPGLPIEKYREIAPVKVEYVHPEDLYFTDLLVNFHTFHNLHEVWEDSIVKAVDKPVWDLPLICPPAIGEDRRILDGNHRVGAAILHTRKMPVFVVENQEDIEAIKKLREAGVYQWAHGDVDFEGLKRKIEACADNASHYEYLEQMERNLRVVDYGEEGEDEETWEYGDIPFGEGVYFNKDLDSDKVLEYCVSRAIHQKYETSEFDVPSADSNPYLYHIFLANNSWRKTKQLEVNNELYEKLRKIAFRNPLVERGCVSHDLDDVVQDTLTILAPLTNWN